MDTLTIWRHKDIIFVLVNHHCHLMDSLAIWTVKTQGQHTCISKLPLSFNGFTYKLHICISEIPSLFNGFTYHLRTQGSIFVSVKYHLHLMDSLTVWKHKSSTFILVNCHCYFMNSYTFWSHKGGIFTLVNYDCHLINSHTVWKHNGSIFVLVN